MWLALLALNASAADADRWLERRRSPKVKAYWGEQSAAARDWVGDEAVAQTAAWLQAWTEAQRPEPVLRDRRGGTTLWQVSRPIPGADDDFRVSAWESELWVQRAGEDFPGTLLPEEVDRSRHLCQAVLDPTGTAAFVGRRQAYDPEICGDKPTGCKVDLECEVDRVALDGDFDTRRVGSFVAAQFSGGPDGERALLVERKGRRSEVSLLDTDGSRTPLWTGRRWISVRWLEDDLVLGWSSSTAKGRRRSFRVWLGPPDDLEPFGRWPRWGPLWSGSVVGVHEDTVLATTDDRTDAPELVMLADDEFRATTVIADRIGMAMGPSRLHQGDLYTTWFRDGLATYERMDLEGTHQEVLDVGLATWARSYRAWDPTMTVLAGTPTAQRIYHVEDGELTLLLEQDLVPGVVFESVLATSEDGTEVPVSLLRPADLEPDGQAPVWLHAYGGFSNSVSPPYLSAQNALWLAAGGVVAVVHARGGVERGEPWHEQAILENLDRTYEDVEAAARWFVDEGFSDEGRIVLTGASNGGLTATATMVRDPDLFGALIPSAGVYDLVHGPRFGRWWPKEYGRRGKEEQMATRRRLSPVDARPPRVPAMLITTGERDPVVDPSHSYKLAKAWSELDGGPVLLHVTPYGSHGGKPTGKRVHDRSSSREASALELAFALKALGVALPPLPGTEPEPDAPVDEEADGPVEDDEAPVDDGVPDEDEAPADPVEED